MAQGATTTPPKFYTIESASRPGYFVTQQGTQLVLNSRNPINPFQLWYRDDSWTFLGEAYVFINHGSKKALKSQLFTSTSRNTYKATVGDYDPAVEDDSIIWSFDTSSGKETLISSYSSTQVQLSHGSWSSSLPDGVPVTSSTVASIQWRVTLYEPTSIYKIQCRWATQPLTSKQKLVDFTVKDAVTHNDEHTVVAVSPNNQLDGMAWYKVPAGGKQDTAFGSSFIVVNRSTGFALKGSTKSGDKVILTQYDPLDNNFVWSENRVQNNGGGEYIVINLDGTTLQWHLETDAKYQNSAFYHPLTLFPATTNQEYLDRQTWAFLKS